jgi:3-oxoacyl-[acyl-carrier protein] reductase
MPVQAMIEQVIADWGSLDILVNNARVKPRIPVLKMDEWDWHRTIDSNLGGPFFTMQSAGG